MQQFNYQLCKVSLSDSNALLKIARNTFVTYFKEFNSEQNLSQYVNKAFTTDKLTAEIANPNSAFYFAKLNNEIVGYLKVNFAEAQTELNDATSLEIERIYVIENFIGKQVGHFLFEKALKIANKNKLNYIWLGVWEQNYRAIRFYEKQNFVTFDKHVFQMGNEMQIDYLMKLIL